MATPRFAWGIDVGNRALKAVRVVPGGNGLVIDEFDVVEHATILSEAGDNRDGLIQTALTEFVSRHPGIEKGAVGIGVPGKSAFAKFVPLPPVEKKKIPEIVRFEAMQQIPFPLDEVEWSYQLFEDPASPDVEVGIFAMRRDLVNQQIKFFTDAKLDVQVVQMNPLAVYNAMYYDSRIKGTTMIVDLGAENTDLIIADGESVWLRSIAIGGNQFTEGLTKDFKVPFDKAEDLKRTASTSKYGKRIMQAMRPFFADLVSEIQRSIGFYSSVHKESRVSRVIALGSTFRLPGLQRYLQQNLTLDVDKIDRLSSAPLEDPKQASAFSENLLSAAGAYGLALQVMGQGKIGSNLLPAQIRQEKQWREKTKWFAAAAALVVLGTGVAYGKHMLESSQMADADHQKVRSDIESAITTGTTANSGWRKIESSGTDARNRMISARSLGDGRAVWQQIQLAIQEALPQNGPTADPRLKDPAQIKTVPRGDRDLVYIESMVSKYEPDLNDLLKEQPGGRFQLLSHVDMAGVNAIPGDAAGTTETGFGPASAAGGGGINVGGVGSGMAAPGGFNGPAPEPRRGYVLTFKLSTPSKKEAKIFDDFNDALKKQPATDDRKFEFAQALFVQTVPADLHRASLVAAWQASQRQKEDEKKQAQEVPAGNGTNPGSTGTGFVPPVTGRTGTGSAEYYPGGPTGSSATPTTLPPEAYEDPAFKEDASKDTEAFVVVAVVLDPPPKPSTQPSSDKRP